MKMIKKLITPIILLALCACFAVPFTGCGNTDTPNLPSTTKNGEWIEVQSITYWTNAYLTDGTTQYVSSRYNLKSACYIETESEEVTEAEYNSATDELKGYPLLSSNFSNNRKEYITTLDNWVNKYYYVVSYEYVNYEYIPTHYFKEAIKSYKLYYVKVRFLDNNNLEINFSNYNENQNFTPNSYNTTIRVLPLSYTVTYFNN